MALMKIVSLLLSVQFFINTASSSLQSSQGGVLNLIQLNLTSAFKQGIEVYTTMPVFATSVSFGKPNDRSSRKTLITLIMSNSYGGEMPVGAISTKAMELALDQLRKRADWLPNYDIALELVDDECVDSTTINRVVPMLQHNDESLNRFPLFLSPACEAFGLRTVAEVIKYYNFVGFSTIQTSGEPFRNRRRFSSFFSLAEQFDLPHIALAEFITRMGWRQIAILSESFPYYDELEKTLLPLLDEKNVTVLWMDKVSHAGVFDDEMQTALDEMIRFDPRIIVVDADRGAGKACWLHRYKLYGPNYATIFFYWSDVYPTPGVPDNLADWCTVDMINEVLASSFILGDTTITDTYGLDIADSTGITGAAWESEMESKLINPKDSPFWGYWRMLPYDNTLFAGYVLNTTEALLNQRNETLLDWIVSSDNFIKNGPVISEIVKQAIYSTQVNGLKGNYHFERRTAVNSLGFTPITFTQIQPPTGNATEPKNVIVALYKSNDRLNKFTIFNERINWSTRDGLPTKDALQIVPLFVPLLAEAEYAVLAALTILALFSCLALLGIAAFQRTFISRFEHLNHVQFYFQDVAILVGNMAMLCQILALPLDARNNIQKHCIAIAVFLMFGYSMSIFGILMKLEKWRLETTFFRLSGYFGVPVTPTIPMPTTVDSSFSKTSKLALALWLFTQAGLLAAFLTVSPLETNIAQLATQGSKLGAFFVHQPYQYTCSFATPLTNNQTALGLIGTIAVLQVSLLLRAAFVSYKLRSRNNGRFLTPEMKNTTMSILCVVLTFMACALIAILVIEYLFIVVSAITLCYVLITTILSILSKFLKPDINNNAQRQSNYLGMTNNNNFISTMGTTSGKFTARGSSGAQNTQRLRNVDSNHRLSPKTSDV